MHPRPMPHAARSDDGATRSMAKGHALLTECSRVVNDDDRVQSLANIQAHRPTRNPPANEHSIFVDRQANAVV